MAKYTSTTLMRFDLGILGGGQLARMSVHAAQRLGVRCLTLDPGESTPAREIAPAIVGRLDDPQAIAEMMYQCDRLTLENEFIPAPALREACRLADYDPERIVPGVETLAIIQDKLLQREAYRRFGVPSPAAVALTGDGQEAIEQIGFPMVLKARFGGYDGKGTCYAKTQTDLNALRESWTGGNWLAEEFVPFRRELAVMVFADGGVRGCFPTVETVQTNHVCDLVFPCDVDASEVAIKAVAAVGGRGLFGVELFELEDGRILVNEMAPRPHNSGHYSLDWGATSQFEQHIRVAVGLSMDPTPNGHPTCMANILGIAHAGDPGNGLREMLMTEPSAHFHWYGKAESRQGRKMGHINVVGENCVEKAIRARNAFEAGWASLSSELVP